MNNPYKDILNKWIKCIRLKMSDQIENLHKIWYNKYRFTQ